jgi:hypothetical protein
VAHGHEALLLGWGAAVILQIEGDGQGHR